MSPDFVVSVFRTPADKRDSGCELESRHAVEHTVRSDQYESHVEGTRSDPHVVGMDGIGKRVADSSARESQSASVVSRPSPTGITVVVSMACSSRLRRS